MFAPETKILVIDDMVTMRKIVKKSLFDLGYKNVTEASDGAMALELLKGAVGESAPFGLIVSDWNMPKMQGIELLRVVREDESLKKTPFILLTAEGEATQIQNALTLGVDSYVLKPFTPQRLKETIQKVYDKIQAAGK